MGNANKKNKNQQSINENMTNEQQNNSRHNIPKNAQLENKNSTLEKKKLNSNIDKNNLEKIKKECHSDKIYRSQIFENKNERNCNYFSEENDHPINLLDTSQTNKNMKKLTQSTIPDITDKNYNKKTTSNPIRSKSISNGNDVYIQKDNSLITNIFKRCDEYIYEANSLIKSNKLTPASELLQKAELGLLNLKDILKKKQINQTEFNKISYRIDQSMIYIKKRSEYCNRPPQTISINNTQPKSINNITNNTKEINSNIISNKNKEIPSQIQKPSTQNNKVISDDIKSKIMSEIMEQTNSVKFDDIIGMNDLKQILKEIIILPQIRPDIFTGLRTPPKGLLLFGPPGTGKTFIAKAVASECKCTFFNISASSLTSKWLGESEKLVRALFEIAKLHQPSIIFFDEIESILSKRCDDDNEASKRIKTEFFIQFDGMQSTSGDRVLLIAATNRPQDLDSAILRRLPKRVYVGPLDFEGRKNFVLKTLENVENALSVNDYIKIANLTENYSNSDLKELCREAAFEPFRELNEYQIRNVKKLRPMYGKDFVKALNVVRGSLSKNMMKELEEWNKQYGQIG